MDTRRVRILVSSIAIAGLITSVYVMPVAAACALSGPASVDIGASLTIDGAGFPASTSVDVAITIEGGSPDEFSLQSDATGAFQISLTPEAADAGVTTFVATSGTDCTAQAIVAVGVPTGTDAPAATDGGAATAPLTDADRPARARPSVAPSMASLVAGLLFLVGIGGLYLTRPIRNRL